MSVHGASTSTAARHVPRSRVSDRTQHSSSHTSSHTSFKGPRTVVSGTKVETFVAPAPSAAPSHHSSSRFRAFTPPSHVSSAAYRHSSSIAPSTVLPSDSASQVGGSVVGSVKAPSIVPVPAPPIHHSSSHISRSLSRSMSAAPAPAPIPSHVSRNVQSLASSHSSRPLSTPSSSNSSTSSGYSVIHAKPNQTVIVPLAHGGCVIVPPKGKRVRVSQVCILLSRVGPRPQHSYRHRFTAAEIRSMSFHSFLL
ncbi:hypothetical protein IW262DRAFT_538805 [Armillaria fumosa]|nr:hypothetical protein IW262DRAFT_1129452 [Armillaria fumosa]KAK0227517.1 hypothetical protein IW262DRAFT_538805 [Armillaria fumosa]